MVTHLDLTLAYSNRTCHKIIIVQYKIINQIQARLIRLKAAV